MTALVPGSEGTTRLANRKISAASAGPVARAELNSSEFKPDRVDEIFLRHKVGDKREPCGQIDRLNDAVDAHQPEHQERLREVERQEQREHDGLDQKRGLRRGK